MSYWQPKIFCHEIRDKFLNPEPLTLRVERILKAGRRFDARFTFFVTASHISSSRSELLDKIVDQGHEIGSHSYDHLNFRDIGHAEAQRQIEASLRVLNKYYPVKGFRAPYLVANDHVDEACRELGLLYNSSRHGKKPVQRDGLWEVPVTRPMDYEVIQLEGLVSTKEISHRWTSFVGPGQVLLFHPWRLGSRKYAWILDNMLASSLKFGTMQQFLKDRSLCCLTFDLDFLQMRQLYLQSLKHLFRSPHLHGEKVL